MMKVSKAWRSAMLEQITKGREIDSNFRRQILQDTVHICEKNFKEDQINKCEYILFLGFRLNYQYPFLSKRNPCNLTTVVATVHRLTDS